MRRESRTTILGRKRKGQELDKNCRGGFATTGDGQGLRIAEKRVAGGDHQKKRRQHEKRERKNRTEGGT